MLEWDFVAAVSVVKERECCLEAVPVTPLESPLFRRAGVRVAMLRLDLTHPYISGNKWFKLAPLRARLAAGERPRLLSFGGAWSNHLHALAWVGREYGIETIAVVRGFAEQPPTATLEDLQRWGMKLKFLPPIRYAEKYSADVQAELRAEYGDFELIPEGGSSADAVVGCRQIWQLLAGSEWAAPHWLVTAVGTGGTLAGLIAGRPEGSRLLGIPVLRADARMPAAIRGLLADAKVSDPGGWELALGLDAGGYARLPAELAASLQLFEARFAVPLEPVYTLKMVMAVSRLVAAGRFAPGSRILLLHTGGLQGRRGMVERIERRASAFSGPLLV